ncbi:hypothetical protein D9M72_559140 [compost metagenome]
MFRPRLAISRRLSRSLGARLDIATVEVVGRRRRGRVDDLVVVRREVVRLARDLATAIGILSDGLGPLNRARASHTGIRKFNRAAALNDLTPHARVGPHRTELVHQLSTRPSHDWRLQEA